jgi:hypothetical protein
METTLVNTKVTPVAFHEVVLMQTGVDKGKT